ncbi:MAG: type II secretion system F family protein [Gemmataceae bacterium]
MSDLLRPVFVPLNAMPPWAAAALVVLAVVLLAVVVYVLLAGAGGLVRRREPDDGPSLADMAEPYLRARRGVGRTDADFDRLAEGTQLGLTGESAAGWILLGGAAAAVLAYLPTFDEFYALIAALLGGLAVFLVLWTMSNRRRRAIQEQLPDGLFQLSRSLRSGLNLPASLRETASYIPTPLSGLFGRLAAALSLGESTRHAVRRVADSARVTEFDLFAEVLALHAESGGNLPAMLDRLAASVRDRNQYRGYFRSVTTLARIGAYFVALSAPAAFVLYLVFQPEMLERFVNEPVGQNMLIAAVVLEVLGLVWITLLLRRQDDY